MKMETILMQKNILIDEITVPERLRDIDQGNVTKIAESIRFGWTLEPDHNK